MNKNIKTRVKYPNRMSEDSRRKQKFAIWNYYRQKFSKNKNTEK